MLLLLFLPVLHRAVRRVAICVAVLGVHYVSDVLAGYLLGAAWVAAMIASFDI